MCFEEWEYLWRVSWSLLADNRTRASMKWKLHACHICRHLTEQSSVALLFFRIMRLCYYSKALYALVKNVGR